MKTKIIICVLMSVLMLLLAACGSIYDGKTKIVGISGSIHPKYKYKLEVDTVGKNQYIHTNKNFSVGDTIKISN
ncbi:MAG: hypothetical protein GY804_00975 [Alphaproteobacteria bacterium]|nr:hypothetical protein [Alphaproteobacteria bacterium]